MEKGSIIAQGTYKELSNKNKQFREMGKMPENKNIKFHIPV
jgi:ABC-type transport system involved in cytochrome bd biosynthesis fused ATPase/permease subunit